MAKRLNITRRDFLNGMALSLAAGTSLSPLEMLATEARRYYPPALTGMRGSHPGSFEIAHIVARTGARYSRPKQQTDATYDLVVVGGGISGLAAAYFYQQQAGRDKKVLVLDNHDDFGGHAKRNEFMVDGHHLIGYGGSMTIDGPANYSNQAKQLLRDIGIETDRFYEFFDQEFFSKRGMGPAFYFSADKYGRDVTAPNVFGGYFGDVDLSTIDSVLPTYPIDGESQREIMRLITEKKDYLAGRSVDEKMALLSRITFNDYLRDYVGMPEPVILLLRDLHKGVSTAGWDAAPASEAALLYLHGTRGLGLEEFLYRGEEDEPYIHHFPDGNAGIARSLVRQLVPGAVPGNTMTDLVTAVADYERLDGAENRCRIRLNATAIDVRHSSDERQVDITYVRGGQPERVVGRHVVLACYNNVIPHICPELPEAQADAIRYAVKVPLVYPNIALRNWRAWDRLRTNRVFQPQTPYMHSFDLDFPVSMGSYRYTSGPDMPVVVHGSVVLGAPGQGLSAKQQHEIGRQQLYEMSFDDHEQLILAQLDGALSPGGFDIERDIAAITVNRWPHGYAYEYLDTEDAGRYSRYRGPHIAGRAQVGRISIANSDSEAYAYADGAIDAAHRAVSEQLAV